MSVTELAIRRTLIPGICMADSSASFTTKLLTARGVRVELRFTENGSPEITLATEEPTVSLTTRELELINDLQREVSAMWDKIGEIADEFAHRGE